MNGPQALSVKPGCFKWILGMNLSPTSKNLFTISFILYTQKNISPNNDILLNRVLRPKLIHSPFASCTFPNVDFLNPHSAHFDCKVNLLFFCFKNLSV